MLQTNYAKKTIISTKLEKVIYNDKFKKYKQEFDKIQDFVELRNMKMQANCIPILLNANNDGSTLSQLYTNKDAWNLKVSPEMMIDVDPENEKEQKMQVRALIDKVLEQITEYGEKMKKEQDELKEKKISQFKVNDFPDYTHCAVLAGIKQQFD